jgi:ubiquinone/menaquinone biosynthesis C-methylase UbiE
LTESTISIDFIKDRMKDVWSSGDFGVIAQIIAHEGEAFIKRLNIPKGTSVLDVACGTGNLAIPAAKAGAIVTGIDIVQHLIAQANERAWKENLNAVFVTGDAEDMPFDDGEFDYVVSMFGAMFGPRPEVVTSELLRVCKPGGTIAMANWTPESTIGEAGLLENIFHAHPSMNRYSGEKKRLSGKGSEIK